MEVAEARAFVEQNHRTVLATHRSGGGIQMSPVVAGVDAEGRVIISSAEPAAKVRNLRRDPRASLCVLTDRFFGEWALIDGTAEIVSLPEALELLVDYYRRVAGEHPDWDEYRQAMQAEQRCLVRITIEHAAS
jgi:PPOX class probable F420-dependent enzyme